MPKVLRKPSQTDQLHPAVVVGVDCITGLQTGRILASRGIRVIGVATNPNNACCRTRSIDSIIQVDVSSEALIETLVKIGAGGERKSVLIPCTDLSVLNISRFRDELDKAYLFRLPEHETLKMLLDKVDFTLYAQQHQLQIPRTRVVTSKEDLDSAIDELRFPCYLKPRIKTDEWLLHLKAKVFKVAHRLELEETYARVSPWTPAMIVQEAIEGPDENHYTCNCYFNSESEPLVDFVSQKIRQWPLDNGVGCISVDCVNDVVRQLTLDLFRLVSFQGLGYLEFKQDQRTGEYLIIEPNVGRPTGRSVLAEACNVELLYTMYCDLTGLPLPENRIQRHKGVKWIYFRKDLVSSVHNWYRGKLTAAKWFRSIRGPKIYAVWDWRDPLPFFYDLLKALGKFFQVVFHRK